MAWVLRIWFGFSDKGCPAFVEEVANQAAGNARAQVILADGYTVTDGTCTHFYPASAINHIKLKEKAEEPEE